MEGPQYCATSTSAPNAPKFRIIKETMAGEEKTAVPTPPRPAKKSAIVAWLVVLILAVGTGLLALYTYKSGNFNSINWPVTIGQLPLVVDEHVNPLDNFARFTCPLRYEMLAEHKAEVEAAETEQSETTTMATDEDTFLETSSDGTSTDEIINAISTMTPTEIATQEDESSSTESTTTTTITATDDPLPQQMIRAMLPTAAERQRLEETIGAGPNLIGKKRKIDKIPSQRISRRPLVEKDKTLVTRRLSPSATAANKASMQSENGDQSLNNGNRAVKNKTQTEYFGGNFLYYCEEQANNGLKQSLETAEGWELGFYQQFLSALFTRLNGYRMYNDSAAIRAANISDDDIWWTMGNLCGTVFPVIVPFYVQLDQSELTPGQRMLSLQQSAAPQLPLYYQIFPDEFVEAKSKYLLSQLRYIGPIVNTSTPANDTSAFIQMLNDVTVFYRELAEMAEPEAKEKRRFSEVQATAIEDRRNRTFTVAQLAKRFPHIGWHAYFQGIGVNITDGRSEITVEQPAFLERLDAYFANKTENGAMHKLIDQMVIAAAEKLSYLKTVNCSDFLDDILPHVNGYWYIRNTDREEREAKVYEVERMVKPIVEEYAAAIADSDWMTPQSKRGAMEKLNALEVNLGWPYWYGLDEPIAYDPEDGLAINASIDRYHAPYIGPFYHFVTKMRYNRVDVEPLEEFDWNESIFMRIMLTLYINKHKQVFESVWKSPDRREGAEPNQFNAFYDSQTNSLSIAYAWMARQFNAEKLVESYGKIGTTIAHEIGHGFDPTGMLYGKYGTLERWMDAETAQRFDQVQQCVVEKFGKCCPAEAANYEIPCVDGWNTQRENFADISGLTISYRTFIRRQSLLNGGQIQLAKRTFWVAYGNKWCQRPEISADGLQLIMTDVHSPNECRVNMATESIPQFYRDFGVEPPADDADKRCHLWEAKPKRF